MRTAAAFSRTPVRALPLARPQRRASRWISTLRGTPATLHAWWASEAADRQIEQACTVSLTAIALGLLAADVAWVLL